MQRILLMLIPLMLAILAFRPEISTVITGKIVDQKGNPLPGVTVSIKGTNTTTTSAEDGSFSISVADENAVLVFSMVGFDQQELTIKGKTSLSVSLKVS